MRTKGRFRNEGTSSASIPFYAFPILNIFPFNLPPSPAVQ